MDDGVFDWADFWYWMVLASYVVVGHGVSAGWTRLNFRASFWQSLTRMLFWPFYVAKAVGFWTADSERRAALKEQEANSRRWRGDVRE